VCFRIRVRTRKSFSYGLGDFGRHGYPHKLFFVAKFRTFSKFRVFLQAVPEMYPKNQENSNDLQNK